MQQFTVPLSHLIPGKRNPRRVKPAREAHNRLVAQIRSQGLIHPLVVRPAEARSKFFQIVAGDRRLAALREIHKGNGDPNIPCTLWKVDQQAADALSLGENFGREPMHPLDEAEAFARLASQEGKGAEAIAAEFGVNVRYIKQRLSLSALAAPIKQAYRENKLDTGMAEAFASVPEKKQLEVWKEVNGHPRHAEQVRNIIANDWIDASHAIFELSTLPPEKVSQDLFGEKILIEREAFMDAQAQALNVQRQAMLEEGWSAVIIGNREDVRDKVLSMDTAKFSLETDTKAKLESLAKEKQKLEVKAGKIDEADEQALEAIGEQIDAVMEESNRVYESAPKKFSEATKAVGTVFLILDPDGKVHSQHRIPRATANAKSASRGGGQAEGSDREPDAPSSDDLSDRQLAVTFTHHALAVREALLRNDSARRRILALILHEKVNSEAIAIRHEANGTTVHATNSEDFESPPLDRLRELRSKLDLFGKKHHVDDCDAYRQLGELSRAKLEELIDLLTVELVAAHMKRSTPLVQLLADELKVNIRDGWKPDADWLNGFQKLQLADLVTKLLGKLRTPAPERKKSELVAQLAKLFADAAQGSLEDKKLIEKLNRWLPSNLRGNHKH